MSAELEASPSDDGALEPGYSPTHVALAVVGVVAAAAVLSLAYGPAEHYSPIVYLNLALAYGLGWLVGIAGRSMLKKYRIAGRTAALLVGGLGGLAAVWFSWLTYIWVISGYDFSEYNAAMWNPVRLWHIIQYLAHDPMWTIGGSSGRRGSADMPAVFYYFTWLCELACIAGVSAKTCLDFAKSNRLCPSCRDWLEPTGAFATLAVPEDNADAVWEAVRGRDVSFLAGLEKIVPRPPLDIWLEAKGFACPSCPEAGDYATLSRVVITRPKNKDLQETKTVLAHFVPIDGEMRKRLFEPAPKAAGGGTPPLSGQ